jgi:hypothetical protein
VGNEEIGALGADRGPGWISFWQSLTDLEMPPLLRVANYGKTSVAQDDISRSRLQKRIIASGQQRSPDAYEVQYGIVQSTLLRTAFQLSTGPMCCHDINPILSFNIIPA